jgi:ADP-ribose pyrophosphatase YjhB (NUDIX family)
MNKQPLLILRDIDIFPDTAIEGFSLQKFREAARIIVLDHENKIALVGFVPGVGLLPGGGVEKGETYKQAAKRECLEEAVCNIEIIRELGFIEEYRAREGRHQLTHGFVARVVGEKGAPTTIQEDELGIRVEWLPFEEIMARFLKQKTEFTEENDNACFNVRTQLAFLEEFQREK